MRFYDYQSVADGLSVAQNPKTSHLVKASTF